MTEKVELEPEVEKALKGGWHMRAIRILRARRNLSLQEAKELVDEYMEQNPEVSPEPYERSSGTMSIVILVAVVLLAGVGVAIFLI
ncbi:MAG: hypothetical protein AAF512_12625 [Pseudomonadota bacterium]